jgi:uncharacterized protein
VGAGVSYDALESSQRAGAPVELYAFSTGSRTWFLTSADTKVVHLTDTYTPDAVSRGPVKEGNEPDAGSVTVTLPRTHPIAQLFIGYIPEPPLRLVLLARHRSDTEVYELFRGQVASARLAGARVELFGLPDIAADDQTIPRNTCQPQCNWALYSSQCGVSKAAFFVSGPVTVVSGDTVQSTAFAGQPSGWLNNGYLERTNGERRWIVDHVGATVTLLSPFLDLVPGEVIVGQAGCDRTEAVCDSKFNNHARFLGFPRVPTKNPFDVGVS